MEKPPLIELQKLCFAYNSGREPVLREIDIRIDPGRRIGLIGPNGCGKTTLLHLIMGILRPRSGTLFFKGRPMAGEADYKQLRRSIGLVFQDADDQLFSPTVLEDVAFGPLNLGMTPDEAREISLQTLNKLELGDLADRVTHQLSGGEKKLVSLATILSMQPEAMLLDEPTNNLDTATRFRLVSIINSLDIACLIISHDWDFLAETCKDLYALENGRAVKSDTSCLHVHRHAHPFGNHPHEHDG
jgi:cobalt/nickel transport system ATP-binding protein